MSETYYTFAATQTGSASPPSGTYAFSGFTVNVTSQIGIRHEETTGLYILELTGNGTPYFISGNVFKQGGIWLSPSGLGVAVSETGLSGVTGLGIESLDDMGRYARSVSDGETHTPVKEGYAFTPENFTYNESSGKGIYITFTPTSTTRQIDTPTPSDTSTGIVLVPLLQWKIDGVSETVDGDLFAIYLKAGDSNFGEDDLLQSGRTSLDIQILWGLSYNTLYYWQVLATSTAEDLLDSAIWTFTTMPFSPPTPSVSVDGSGNLTGENNMVTIKRLVTAARNRIYYEDL